MRTTLVFSILFFLLLSATLFCRLKGTGRQVFPEGNGAIPGPRYDHYMCPIGDQQVLMIGGRGGGNPHAYSETWIYDYKTNVWTKVLTEHELDTYFSTAWPGEFLCQISKNRVLGTLNAYVFDLDSLKGFAINDKFKVSGHGVFLEENVVFGYTAIRKSFEYGYGVSNLIHINPEAPIDSPDFLTSEVINDEETTKQGPNYTYPDILNDLNYEKYFAYYDSSKVTGIPAASKYASFMNAEREIGDWLFLEQSQDTLPHGSKKKYSQLTKNATLMHNDGFTMDGTSRRSDFFIIEYSPETNQMSTYQIDPPGNGVYNCKMAQIKDGVVMLFGGMSPTGLLNETGIFELDCLDVVDNTGENVNIYILDDNLYMLGDNLKDATLYNILGQKVIAVAGDKLDLNPLPIGVYFLQYNEKGVAKAVKVVRR